MARNIWQAQSKMFIMLNFMNQSSGGAEGFPLTYVKKQKQDQSAEYCALILLNVSCVIPR